MGKNQNFGKKRPKSYYRKSGSNYTKQDKMLQSGMKGILITCSGNASQCVREAYNLLNEYADRLYGPEEVTKGGNHDAEDDDEKEASEEDIADSLQKEVSALKEQGKSKDRRFKNVLTGAKNVIFIQTNGVDPHRIVDSILTDLEETKTLKGRYIQRMLPVSHTCRAFEDHIEKTAQEMLYPAFHHPDARDSTFCIQFKARNNGQIKKDPIVQLLAPMVTQGSTHVHRVNFDDPDQTVTVDVIGAVCCLSVLQGYGRFKRYNLHQVAQVGGNLVARSDGDLVARSDGDLVALDNRDLVSKVERPHGLEKEGGSEENRGKRKRGDLAESSGDETGATEPEESQSDHSGSKRQRAEDPRDLAATNTDHLTSSTAISKQAANDNSAGSDAVCDLATTCNIADSDEVPELQTTDNSSSDVAVLGLDTTSNNADSVTMPDTETISNNTT